MLNVTGMDIITLSVIKLLVVVIAVQKVTHPTTVPFIKRRNKATTNVLTARMLENRRRVIPVIGTSVQHISNNNRK